VYPPRPRETLLPVKQFHLKRTASLLTFNAITRTKQARGGGGGAEPKIDLSARRRMNGFCCARLSNIPTGAEEVYRTREIVRV